MLQKTNEALYAAEEGRAQALQDALEIKYGFPSFPHRCNKPEEEVTNISRKTSTLTAFLAIQMKQLIHGYWDRKATLYSGKQS